MKVTISPPVKLVFRNARECAREYGEDAISPEHYLYSILSLDIVNHDALFRLGFKNPLVLQRRISDLLNQRGNRYLIQETPTTNTIASKEVIQLASYLSKKAGQTAINIECLLLALSIIDCTAKTFLKDSGFNGNYWYDHLDEYILMSKIHKLISIDDYVEIKPLKIVIDPGNSNSEEIANFLAEISILYRMCGGSGLQLEMVELKDKVGVLS